MPKPCTATVSPSTGRPERFSASCEAEDGAARGRLRAAERAADRERLAGDDAEHRVALVHRVRVEDPRHHGRVRADVRRRDVLLRPDLVHDLRRVAARHPLELARGELPRVADDAALRAAERQVHQRALPRHRHRERLDLVERDVGVVADPALRRPARDVVRDAPAGEDADGAVVHRGRDRDLDRLLALLEHVDEVIGDPEHGRDVPELAPRELERVLLQVAPPAMATGREAYASSARESGYGERGRVPGGGGDHRRVVGAERERRGDCVRERGAQLGVGGDAADDRDPVAAGGLEPLDERAHDRALVARREVGAARLELGRARGRARRRAARSSAPRRRSRARARARPGTSTRRGRRSRRAGRPRRRRGTGARAAARPCRTPRRRRRRASARARASPATSGRGTSSSIVWPPLASRHVNGGSRSVGRRKSDATCPCRWSTATSGSRRAHASAFAAATPTSSAPISPGPAVTPTASTSSSVAPAPASASSITGATSSRCRRDATSGTTPPNRACSSACEATTFARISPSSVTTAAAVSSHDVSRPRITLRRRGRAQRLPHGPNPAHPGGPPSRTVTGKV